MQRKILGGIVLSFLVCCAHALDWPHGVGQYRRPVTIDHAKISQDLTNFPVLVRLTTNNFDFALASSNGFDVRFTQSDGVTPLVYERERHDATLQRAEYWVSIPIISSSISTNFYVYYGQARATDRQTPQAVWTNIGYIGVWHLSETNGICADSTAFTNHATPLKALDEGDIVISTCGDTNYWSGDAGQ